MVVFIILLAAVVALIINIHRRRQAETALRQSEERLRLAVEGSGVGLWDWRVQTGEVAVNERWAAIVGYGLQELAPISIDTWIRLAHPDDLERSNALLQKHFAGETPAYECEARMKHKDGHWVWVLDRGRVTEWGRKGQPVRMTGTHLDISERKKAEDALREKDALHRSILRTAMDGFLRADAQGRLLEVNETYCRMSGYSEQELLRMRIADIESGETGAETSGHIAKVMELGEDRFESRHRRQDGTVFDVEISVQYRPAEGGQLVCFLRDITERKRGDAERALLASAIDQAEENVLVTDARRTIEYINPAFERSSGYRLQDLKGKKLKFLRSAQHGEAFYRNMKEVLDRGEVWMGVIINRGKDGMDFEIEGTISPLRDASGAVTHFVAAGRNMSRFRKLERELYQAQKMESVGRLAGGVAHDFNNMLGVILGHAELALDDIDPTQRAYTDLQEIVRASHRSASLIRQLLAFARKQTISPKVLDINETVESMLKMVQRLIGEDIELVWNPGGGVWPVKLDPTQIDQILANLCVNARDAIARAGTITIETGNVVFDELHSREHPGVLPGEYVLLTVSDDGLGMEKEVLERLFEPFFTTKEVGKGTGLGLATVYGIVKQNGGFIDVTSEPARGTTFRIYLPRTHISPTDDKPPQPQKKDLKGTETILLVEDEESILELGKSILEHHGYRVLTARSPAQALDLAKDYAARIDLLITDVIMPDMNGKELSAKLGAFKPGFRSIFMSGYTGDVIAQHGVLDEGIDFLPKPFSVKMLAEKVREVLDA